ncbi:MAG: hypothetical protein NZ602_15445 [Thermoguttaceae bacterium]|nr:hypothetical protein [Thermoguttaceae bacterium]MDW8039731.1 hypothetical protein [Thermoguttaceae bacterium]
MNAARLSASVGLVAIYFLSLSAAQASWIELSSSWQAQGLGSGWGLVADPVGNTLYAFNGNQGKNITPPPIPGPISPQRHGPLTATAITTPWSSMTMASSTCGAISGTT